MSDPFSILSTKILHEGVRREILSLGWGLREEDFIETSPLFGLNKPQTLAYPEYIRYRKALGNAIRAIDNQTAVVFTSEKALTHFPWVFSSMSSPIGSALYPGGEAAPLPPNHPSMWHVACLSGKTLNAVNEQLTEEQVVCTAHNAIDLAGAIIADGRYNRAVFFCALEHRPDLPEALGKAGIPVEEIPIYETLGLPRVIDTPFNAVLFFSPSGVEQFFQLNGLRKGTTCFAIGETTASAIRNYTEERVISSFLPTQEELLRSVRFFYDNQQSYE